MCRLLKRNAAAGVFVKERDNVVKLVPVAVIRKHPFLALHVLFVGGHAPVKDAIGHWICRPPLR